MYTILVVYCAKESNLWHFDETHAAKHQTFLGCDMHQPVHMSVMFLLWFAMHNDVISDTQDAL